MVIPYGRQDVQDSDIEAVLKVLNSDFLTQGPVVPLFEAEVAKQCKANFSVAVNSATSALHLALISLGVGSGDIVWTSPITFVASANAALYCGAQVDFVDIDPTTYNMSITALTKKLIHAKAIGQLPKVVVPVHLTGQSCDMKPIYELGQKYGFKIVEDASHALGGHYFSQPIGNCAFSDITVFSFHAVKIITTCEGGVAVTNQVELAEKMALYRSHGITRDPLLMTRSVDGPWFYQQITLGYNYRMTEIQAALGLSQIKRLKKYVRRRHEIASRYNRDLATLPLTLPRQSDFASSAYHLYVVRLDLDAIAPLSHVQVFQEMRDRGILVNIHYIPVHTQPYYQAMGFNWGDFPNAEGYYRNALSIPIYPKMNDLEHTQVIEAIHQVVGK
jgi:UDP-4-amino-4,6-dideoxy-N-acetyl-beta-L-altrosamine transaminase